MKINKKTGKVRIESNEVRVGNFFVKREENHIKITDLNGVFFHSVHRRMPIGIWLENIWARACNAEEAAINTLKTYIAAMWSLFSVAPDDEYISDVINISKSALERHPDWYGIKNNATEAEDAEAVKSVEEMKEFEKDMETLAKKADAAEGKEGEVPVEE